MKLLLFDIDGTLLLTSGAGMRSMGLVTREMFGEEFDWEGISFGGQLDPVIFNDFLEKHGIDHSEELARDFHDRYVAQLKQELSGEDNGAYSLPGIIELLEKLRQRECERGDIILGLLTGNFTAASPVKLMAAGIEPQWFDLTVFGDEAETRPGLVDVALRKFSQMIGGEADPQDVIVIGDTEHDIACAKAHGCVAFAVATGFVDYKDLEKAGADVVVKDLVDAGPLMKLIGK